MRDQRHSLRIRYCADNINVTRYHQTFEKQHISVALKYEYRFKIVQNSESTNRKIHFSTIMKLLKEERASGRVRTWGPAGRLGGPAARVLSQLRHLARRIPATARKHNANMSCSRSRVWRTIGGPPRWAATLHNRRPPRCSRDKCHCDTVL